MILICQSKYEKNANCTRFNCCLVTGSVVKPFGQSFNVRRHQTPEKHHKRIFSPFGQHSTSRRDCYSNDCNLQSQMRKATYACAYFPLGKFAHRSTFVHGASWQQKVTWDFYGGDSTHVEYTWVL